MLPVCPLKEGCFPGKSLQKSLRGWYRTGRDLLQKYHRQYPHRTDPCTCSLPEMYRYLASLRAPDPFPCRDRYIAVHADGDRSYRAESASPCDSKPLYACPLPEASSKERRSSLPHLRPDRSLLLPPAFFFHLQKQSLPAGQTAPSTISPPPSSEICLPQ